MTTVTTQTTTPTPERVFDMAFAFERTAALKAAVELDLFTGISNGFDRAAALATHCQASERGVRILCDFLTVWGLLTKDGDRYALAPDAAMFLTKGSRTYLGGAVQFLTSRELMKKFEGLAETVRRGTVSAENNHVAGVEQPHWVEFAQAMVPMMMPAALGIAGILQIASAGPVRVLDIAAGHGMFGLTLVQQNPQAETTALDWPGVLTVASENARRLGVSARFHTIPGDAFAVDFGGGYDVVLLTNFLHHFDTSTCVKLLQRVADAMKPGGRAVILEFVPNEDRVSPPIPAGFGLTMLAGTPSGDAYTFRQLREMAEQAGFRGGVTHHPLPTFQTIVIATK